jgi:hypothetical protein
MAPVLLPSPARNAQVPMLKVKIAYKIGPTPSFFSYSNGKFLCYSNQNKNTYTFQFKISACLIVGLEPSK